MSELKVRLIEQPTLTDTYKVEFEGNIVGYTRRVGDYWLGYSGEPNDSNSRQHKTRHKEKETMALELCIRWIIDNRPREV